MKVFNEEEPEPVDTTELEQLINTANSINNDDESYTTESYTALQRAITEAEDAIDSIETDEELTQAINALQGAIDGLEDVPEPEPEEDEEE